MQEFELTSWLRTHGLPVQKVFAAQIRWVGPLLYRTAILKAWTAGAPALHTCRPDASSRCRMGQTVRKIHHAGVCRSDLNRRNIPLEGVGAVCLIDFDKCARRAPGAWIQRNLDRLHRSLLMYDGQGTLQWTAAGWTAFFGGYRKGARP